MAKHRSDQEWASILSAFRHSGLSQAAFCRRRSLALSTFRLHLAASRRGKSPPPPPADGASGSSPTALLELPLLASPRGGGFGALASRHVSVAVEFPSGARASLAVPAEGLASLLAELHRLPRP